MFYSRDVLLSARSACERVRRGIAAPATMVWWCVSHRFDVREKPDDIARRRPTATGNAEEGFRAQIIL